MPSWTRALFLHLPNSTWATPKVQYVPGLEYSLTWSGSCASKTEVYEGGGWAVVGIGNGASPEAHDHRDSHGLLARICPLSSCITNIEFCRWTKRDLQNGLDFEEGFMTPFLSQMIITLSMRGKVDLNASGMASVQLPLTEPPTTSQTTPGILQPPGHPLTTRSSHWTPMKIPTMMF